MKQLLLKTMRMAMAIAACLCTAQCGDDDYDVEVTFINNSGAPVYTLSDKIPPSESATEEGIVAWIDKNRNWYGVKNYYTSIGVGSQTTFRIHDTHLAHFGLFLLIATPSMMEHCTDEAFRQTVGTRGTWLFYTARQLEAQGFIIDYRGPDSLHRDSLF